MAELTERVPESVAGRTFLITKHVLFPQLADEVLDAFRQHDQPVNISADNEGAEDPFVSPEGATLLLTIDAEGMSNAQIADIVQPVIAEHTPDPNYGESLITLDTVRGKLIDGEALNLEDVAVALKALLL